MKVLKIPTKSDKVIEILNKEDPFPYQLIKAHLINPRTQEYRVNWYLSDKIIKSHVMKLNRCKKGEYSLEKTL